MVQRVLKCHSLAFLNFNILHKHTIFVKTEKLNIGIMLQTKLQALIGFH